jgi:hypothetical protein
VGNYNTDANGVQTLSVPATGDAGLVIDTNFATLSGLVTGHTTSISTLQSAIVPIGGVIGWLMSLTNTPALPAGYVQLNGQVLTDALSPYNGQTLPNLNTGTQRFLRGASTSGGTGGSDTHTHPLTISLSTGLCGTAFGANNVIQTASLVNATVTGSTSTLPSYYQVVWVMRVH